MATVSDEPADAGTTTATRPETAAEAGTGSHDSAEVRAAPSLALADVEATVSEGDDRPGTGDPAFPPGPDGAAAARGHERGAPANPQTAVPQGVTRQLAEAAAASADRSVEVTLSPEELGRVRLSFTTQDGALTMLVQAERPETLELLRRHIGSLADEFRGLGYEDVTFSFGQRGDQHRFAPPRQAPHAPGRESDTLISGALDLRTVAGAATYGRADGLDLRL